MTVALPSARWEYGPVSDSTEPACDRCGYPARGLTTFICPECGSDLREVGIRTPAMRRAAGPIAIVIARTLLVGVPALVVTALLSGILTEQTAEGTMSFAPPFTERADTPPAGTLDTLTVTYTGARLSLGGGRAQRTPVDHATFIVQAVGHRPTSLEVDVKRRTATGTFEPSRTRSGEMNQPLVLAWLAAAGLDAGSPATRQLADEIVASADELRADRPDGVGFSRLERGGGGSGVSSGPAPLVTVALAILWGVVWLVAVVRGLRGRI